MHHHLAHQLETLLLLASADQQETHCEVETLSVTYLREVEGQLPQHLLKTLDIGFDAEVWQLGECAGDVFGDLREARVGEC